MLYIDLYKELKEKINYTDNVIKLSDGIIVENHTFHSKFQSILPGGSDNTDTYEFPMSRQEMIESDPLNKLVHETDSEIQENLNFRYHIMRPDKKGKSESVILFFHGFNEKYWDKYLPWAYHIVKATNKSILMFPIAFHMNRAPAIWSNKREMYTLSQQRKEKYPGIISSSLSNVAISARLNSKPQRFVWSGIQTYYDVISLIESIKQNNHPTFEADANIDFFSYSIGTFLGEIIMLTNYKNYFSNSKFATFCGGAVFNRLSPVSKFILDSEANVALYSYVVEHLESHIKRDPKLREVFKNSEVGLNFARMLNYNYEMEIREEKFKDMADRFLAIVLKQDIVIPFYEVMNTLQGSARDIPIKIEVKDFTYKHIHEDPFPALESIREEVDFQYKSTFDTIANFLK